MKKHEYKYVTTSLGNYHKCNNCGVMIDCLEHQVKRLPLHLSSCRKGTKSITIWDRLRGWCYCG